MASSSSQQIVEAEGETWKEARELIESQLPEGLSILSVDIIVREDGGLAFGRRETIDEAYADAQRDLPDDCDAVSRTVMVDPDRRVVGVEAFDEQNARAQVEGQLGQNEEIKVVNLIASGRRGFLGIGKTPGRYEIEVIRQAMVEIRFARKARISATIGVPLELAQEEMGALHDLLAIFSTYGSSGGMFRDSEEEREYVEWWHQNQAMAPEIVRKLEVLSESGSPVLNRAQAGQLSSLLRPVLRYRLNSAEQLSHDEIAARLHFGYDVTHWHVDGLNVLHVLPGSENGTGYVEGLFRECYQALGVALGR